MNGIDVSQHNGIIDWDKVKASGKVDFVILRCGFGREHSRQIDRTFERNYAECKRVGLPVGVYHYSYADSAADAEKEAEFCLKLISGKQLEFPVWFDVEERSHVLRGNCDDLVKAFCGRLEAAGYYAGVYSFDSFFASNLSADITRRYAAWSARVGNIKPTACKNVGMWQHSWRGSIPGISGDVDTNISYYDYPSAIKKRCLNGFSEVDKQRFSVSAVADNLTAEQAAEIMKKCSEMGMTAVRQRKEV